VNPDQLLPKTQTQIDLGQPNNDHRAGIYLEEDSRQSNAREEMVS